MPSPVGNCAEISALASSLTSFMLSAGVFAGERVAGELRKRGKAAALLRDAAVFWDSWEASISALDRLPGQLVDDSNDPPLKRWRCRLRRTLLDLTSLVQHPHYRSTKNLSEHFRNSRSEEWERSWRELGNYLCDLTALQRELQNSQTAVDRWPHNAAAADPTAETVGGSFQDADPPSPAANAAICYTPDRIEVDVLRYLRKKYPALVTAESMESPEVASLPALRTALRQLQAAELVARKGKKKGWQLTEAGVALADRLPAPEE